MREKKNLLFCFEICSLCSIFATENPKNQHRMKKSILSVVLTLVCMGVTAQDDATLATRQQQFAFDIFQKVIQNEKEGDNICFSPLSASKALSLVQNGADSNTLEELQTALGFKGLSCEEVNRYNQQLTESLTSLPPFTYDPDGDLTESEAREQYEWEHPICELANALWTKVGFSCYESFYETLRTYYDAGIGSVDFCSQEGIDVINGWVNDKTHGLIPQIYDEPQDPLLLVVLANMLYFKGCWTHQFKTENTKAGTFHQLDGSTVEADMLNVVESFKTGKTDRFYTITLPYGNGKFTMTIFLPIKDVHLPVLTYADWKASSGADSKYKYVHLQMPRFSIEGKYELKDVLAAIGIRDAFGGDADFSKMSSENLYISRVFQSSKIGVDEIGTEAAAVTVVEMRKWTSPSPDMDFIIDRPFYFTIEADDAILFAGCVNQLQGNSDPQPSNILGDVNGDGSVTISDVTMMVNYTLGEQKRNFIATNADVNNDGIISISDITDTVNIILGKGE